MAGTLFFLLMALSSFFGSGAHGASCPFRLLASGFNSAEEFRSVDPNNREMRDAVSSEVRARLHNRFAPLLDKLNRGEHLNDEDVSLLQGLYAWSSNGDDTRGGAPSVMSKLGTGLMIQGPLEGGGGTANTVVGDTRDRGASVEMRPYAPTGFIPRSREKTHVRAEAWSNALAFYFLSGDQGYAEKFPAVRFDKRIVGVVGETSADNEGLVHVTLEDGRTQTLRLTLAHDGKEHYEVHVAANEEPGTGATGFSRNVAAPDMSRSREPVPLRTSSNR